MHGCHAQPPRASQLAAPRRAYARCPPCCPPRCRTPPFPCLPGGCHRGRRRHGRPGAGRHERLHPYGPSGAQGGQPAHRRFRLAPGAHRPDARRPVWYFVPPPPPPAGPPLPDAAYQALPAERLEAPRVAIWTLTVSARLPEALLRELDGLVLAGSGTGSVPGGILEQLAPAWTERLPIVLSSRCGVGANHDDFFYRGRWGCTWARWGRCCLPSRTRAAPLAGQWTRVDRSPSVSQTPMVLPPRSPSVCHAAAWTSTSAAALWCGRATSS